MRPKLSLFIADVSSVADPARKEVGPRIIFRENYRRRLTAMFFTKTMGTGKRKIVIFFC